MLLSPISVSCPQCGSSDIVYSCTPACCFNHVCNHCYTTFELETSRIGEIQEDFAMPPDPDPSKPTAPCARCGETKVFAIVDSSDPKYICVCCKALLALHFKEVSPG